MLRCHRQRKIQRGRIRSPFARGRIECFYSVSQPLDRSDKGNIRDYATINQLICMSNMENLNAVFINEGLLQGERLQKLNQIAIQQMTVLENVESKHILKQ